MLLAVVVTWGAAVDISEAYKAAMNLTKTPSVMVLTRQNLPTVDRTKYASASGVAKGAYVLADCDGTPDAILIGTGSEVGLCLKAADALAAEGVKARVVSAPCLDIFAQQSAEYRESVLPKNVKARVGVELGVELGWGKLIGDCGKFLGMTTFGDSAPAAKLMEHFGFTVDHVVALAKESINEAR